MIILLANFIVWIGFVALDFSTNFDTDDLTQEHKHLVNLCLRIALVSYVYMFSHITLTCSVYILLVLILIYIILKLFKLKNYQNTIDTVQIVL